MLTTVSSKRYRNLCNLSRGFMQIRIRHLSRAAPETVQRATHIFKSDHFLDSVPFGVPQMANTPENLRSWLQKSGCTRYWKYILQKSDLQEKLFFSRRYNIYATRICENLITTLQTPSYIMIKTVRNNGGASPTLPLSEAEALAGPGRFFD